MDFSDIPELTDAQLARARRVGRPPFGRAARELIAIRVDPDVLRSLRVEATRTGSGYQTLIHKLLAAHVRKSA
ncbi:MAG: BrnA antitoxin family protein [Deltaproteobacteria bacterium]|nr:BrnA antitoxin family protein [Deltaproteobacteria bacterium]